jgi:hypothetical protein
MKKKDNPMDIVKEKNKQIDDLFDMMSDENMSEADKHRKLDKFVADLGIVASMVNHIEEKRKGPMFPNG